MQHIFSIFLLFSFFHQINGINSEFEDGLFLAKITAIDVDDIQQIANFNGFEIKRKLLSFDDVFIGRKFKKRPRKKREIESKIVEQLILNQQIDWIEKLQNFQRFTKISHPFERLPVHVWNLKPTMKIKEAWKQGFNANNITIAVVDDGVDVNHVDLQRSFSPDVSFDFVRFQNIQTSFSKNKYSEHGTQCAGLVSMEGNRCGLGVGYGAKLGAIRLLGSDMLNDALEGEALAFEKDNIDIYSISWGPKDDGKTAEKPQKFTEFALQQGVSIGRKGKGNIYVWASGNGGNNGDNCALDGYVSNENTISFGAINSDGSPSSYTESCSAVISAVSGGDSMIRTTGFDSKCSSISGSSALAAIASGIIGLALEANPHLTQRDIQHLIVKSSDFEKIKNLEFSTNSAGHKFHPKVGFGLLDASKFVELAKTWKNVGKVKKCEIRIEEKIFSPNNFVEFKSEKCDDLDRIERVSIQMDLFHQNRGNIQLILKSPNGTSSEILPFRFSDSSQNLLNWSFVSTNFFNEKYISTESWKLFINSKDNKPYQIKNLALRLIGN